MSSPINKKARTVPGSLSLWGWAEGQVWEPGEVRGPFLEEWRVVLPGGRVGLAMRWHW